MIQPPFVQINSPWLEFCDFNLKLSVTDPNDVRREGYIIMNKENRKGHYTFL